MSAVVPLSKAFDLNSSFEAGLGSWWSAPQVSTWSRPHKRKVSSQLMFQVFTNNDAERSEVTSVS